MKLQIKEVAYKYGMTLQDLADKLGIHRQSLYQYTTGNPTSAVLMRIADIIGCSVGELFGEQPHPLACKCPHCGKLIKIRLE